MGHDGASALHWAAGLRGNLKIVKLLIARGADINLQGKGKGGYNVLSTPLHQAVSYSRVDIVKFLLSQPACDPTLLDHNQESPLHYVMTQNEGLTDMSKAREILSLLLAHPRVDPNGGTDAGAHYTPLQKACYKGEVWAVQILLAQEGIQLGARRSI